MKVKRLPEYSKGGYEMNANIKKIYGKNDHVYLELKVLDNHTLFNAVHLEGKPVRVTIEEIKI